jgi:hypothetical protein
MANKDVSTPTARKSAMVAEARPIRLLVAGTKAMRAAGENTCRGRSRIGRQLQRPQKKSFLFGATGKTVDDMTGKVFTKPIQVERDRHPELQTWFDNIDNAGRHLNVFARDVFQGRDAAGHRSFSWTCRRPCSAPMASPPRSPTNSKPAFAPI